MNSEEIYDTFDSARKMYDISVKINKEIASFTSGSKINSRKMNNFFKENKADYEKYKLYYIKQQKEHKREIIRQLIISLIILLIVFALGIYGLRLWNAEHISSNEASLQTAINDISIGEYESATKILNALIDKGWNGYTVYSNLAWSYQSLNNYDMAAKVMIEYIDKFIGTVNTRTTDDLFLWMQNEMNASYIQDAELRSNYYTIEKKIEETALLYDQIEKDIYYGECTKALHSCETLKTAGAENSDFAGLYVSALIGVGKIEEAYEYVINLACSDNTYMQKSISDIDRGWLIRGIYPYLNDAQKSKCNEIVNQTFQKLHLHTGLQYGTKSVDEKKEEISNSLTHHLIDELHYLKSFDDIEVEWVPYLINGQKCYKTDVKHIDGKELTTKTFYVENRLGYIYYNKNGTYVNLTQCSPMEVTILNKSTLNSKEILGEYRYIGNDNLHVIVHDVAKIKENGWEQEGVVLTIEDVSNGKIYYDNLTVPFVDYYSVLESDKLDCSLIWSENRLTILTSSAYNETYGTLDGIYQKEK